MLLLFSSDLHGDATLYAALLELALERAADAVIVAGDLLPHTTRRASALAEQRQFLDHELRPLLEQARYTQPGLQIYLLPGNDDWLAVVRDLDLLEQQGLLRTLHQKSWPLANGLSLAGYACVPLTPFSIKDFERRDDGPLPADYSFAMALSSGDGSIQPIDAATLAAQPSIADDLAELAQKSDPSATIYVCHAPPANTALDRTRLGKHIGSRALRSFIVRHQPPITFHGHVHEAPQVSGRYSECLGTTRLVAAGQDGQRLHAVAFDPRNLDATLWHTIYGNCELRVASSE